MTGFERAVAEGVDILEFDVRATADGEIVVIHDATVDRTTDWSRDIPGEVAALTFEELSALDAGHSFTPDEGKTFPFRGQGVTIPKLEDVLTAFPEHLYTIELKPSPHPEFVSRVAAIVQRHAADRAILASFHHVFLKAMRLEAPELTTSLSGEELRNFFLLSSAWLGWLFSTSARVIQMPVWSNHDNDSGIRMVTKRFLKAAHGRGITVQCWTINDPDQMRELIALGVDGITTDRPDLLKEVVESRS